MMAPSMVASAPPMAMTQNMMHVGPRQCHNNEWPTSFTPGMNFPQPHMMLGYSMCVGPQPLSGFPGHPIPDIRVPMMPLIHFPWAWQQPLQPQPVPHTAMPATTPVPGSTGTPGPTGDASWSKRASVQEPATKSGGGDPDHPDDEEAPEEDASSAPTSEIQSLLRQRLKRNGDRLQRAKRSLGGEIGFFAW